MNRRRAESPRCFGSAEHRDRLLRWADSEYSLRQPGPRLEAVMHTRSWLVTIIVQSDHLVCCLETSMWEQ